MSWHRNCWLFTGLTICDFLFVFRRQVCLFHQGFRRHRPPGPQVRATFSSPFDHTSDADQLWTLRDRCISQRHWIYGRLLNRKCWDPAALGYHRSSVKSLVCVTQPAISWIVLFYNPLELSKLRVACYLWSHPYANDVPRSDLWCSIGSSCLAEGRFRQEWASKHLGSFSKATQLPASFV